MIETQLLSFTSIDIVMLSTYFCVPSGPERSELFHGEDSCDQNQRQQPETRHHLCLPHPHLLQPSTFCSFFLSYFFFFLLLVLVSIFPVCFLFLLQPCGSCVAPSARLWGLQRTAAAADAGGTWVCLFVLEESVHVKRMCGVIILGAIWAAPRKLFFFIISW